VPGPPRGRPGFHRRLAARDLIADTQGVSLDAAFVAMVVAFAAGWLWRGWRGLVAGAQANRVRYENANSAAWRARLWFAGVVILVWGLADLWIQNH
jgi:hypothetical protein